MPQPPSEFSGERISVELTAGVTEAVVSLALSPLQTFMGLMEILLIPSAKPPFLALEVFTGFCFSSHPQDHEVSFLLDPQQMTPTPKLQLDFSRNTRYGDGYLCIH